MQLVASHALMCTLALLATVSLPGAASPSRETSAEAVQQARNLLVDPSTFGVATLSTVYPSNFSDISLAGRALSGPEYFAPCYEDGDLLFLALPVSQNWRNVLNSASGQATLSIEPSADPSSADPRHATSKGTWSPHRSSWRKGMPSKQRLTLFGQVRPLPASDVSAAQRCFTAHHPDAAHWTPGSDSPHLARFVRFKVQKVYRVGGFGDESWIGWIDVEQWRRTRPQKLPSETWWNIVEGRSRTAGPSQEHFADDAEDASPSSSVDYTALFGDSPSHVTSTSGSLVIQGR